MRHRLCYCAGVCGCGSSCAGGIGTAAPAAAAEANTAGGSDFGSIGQHQRQQWWGIGLQGEVRISSHRHHDLRRCHRPPGCRQRRSLPAAWHGQPWWWWGSWGWCLQCGRRGGGCAWEACLPEEEIVAGAPGGLVPPLGWSSHSLLTGPTRRTGGFGECCCGRCWRYQFGWGRQGGTGGPCRQQPQGRGLLQQAPQLPCCC
mmetsp:Transcript_146192/g.364539  ORF Transcript_146192/g.364539 Transcript_146192/m.364539 type:complete len:201 (-) Transcript_146192:319-921(-)